MFQAKLRAIYRKKIGNNGTGTVEDSIEHSTRVEVTHGQSNDYRLNLVTDESATAAGTAALIDKSTTVMTRADERDVGTRKHRGNVYTDGALVSNPPPSVNSTRGLKFADRLESYPPFRAFTNNVAMDFKETQIKRMEAETVTNRSVQTGEPNTSTTLDIATPRKNLLTVISRTTAITSSVLPLTAPDVRLNPRTESSRETFANTSPGTA
ncbi:PREDICTED: uncharacterized protein LOC107194722 [Dufourea novaeangliae]|uniref:uncharacterized protein LOC107194722 n=1 Tax=Dufourea novaeangliae TaxID=178035 RepID=UPI0007672B49|nr:PREDICTED: uncharacterized protein LOC107194722 [Dufourea novaeangliae]